MPLLMCPNCQDGMREITREGVQIDMCPKCHGVWLDRGELQKLLDAAGNDSAHMQQPQTQPSYPPRPQQHYGHGGGYPSHGKYRKKSKLESIFDIFD